MFQLAVTDMHCVRNITKKLRSGPMRQLLVARHISLPPLDVPTRWNSTFTMVKSMLDEAESFRVLEGIDVSDELWAFMEEFCKAF